MFIQILEFLLYL